MPATMLTPHKFIMNLMACGLTKVRAQVVTAHCSQALRTPHRRCGTVALCLAASLFVFFHGMTVSAGQLPASKQAAVLDDADAWIRQGLANNAAGRYQEALDAFLQAVVIDPANSFALFNLGTTSALLGRYREGASYLKEAVRIAPDLLPAWSNLGAMHNHLNQPAEALAAFRQVLRLQPGNTDAHYQAALALLALGRRDEACTEYEALRKLDTALAERLLPMLSERNK